MLFSNGTDIIYFSFINIECLNEKFNYIIKGKCLRNDMASAFLYLYNVNLILSRQMCLITATVRILHCQRVLLNFYYFVQKYFHNPVKSWNVRCEPFLILSHSSKRDLIKSAATLLYNGKCLVVSGELNEALHLIRCSRKATRQNMVIYL